MEVQNSKKSVFTVKNVIRVLSMLCIVIVFCPTFLVSCSGETMNVNVMTAVGGLESSYGAVVVDPQPIMLLCLILPIAILVLLFIKKMKERILAIVIIVCAAVDTILWFAFKEGVKQIAGQNYCEYSTTFWFYLNLIALTAIIATSILVIAQVVTYETDLMVFAKGEKTQEALNQMSAAVSQMSSSVTQLAGDIASNVSGRPMKTKNTIGFCSKCGSPIAYGNKFCVSCGATVPESMIKEAEEARKAAEEQARLAAEETQNAAEQAANNGAVNAAGNATPGVPATDPMTNASANPTPMQAPGAGTKKFCKECGAPLEAGTRFCHSCGTPV